MAEFVRHFLYYFFHSFTKYDYMAMGWVVFLAFLLLFLGAFVKKRGLSYLFLLFGLIFFFFGPPAIKFLMDSIVRRAEIDDIHVKPLHYSRATLVEGNITNKGKIVFSQCDLVLLFYRYDPLFKNLSPWLRNKKVYIQTWREPLERGETKTFSIIVDNYLSDYDDNVSVEGRCYP